MAAALSPTMTVREFENGYWYLVQLKPFAERIGIPAARKLRKDELETAIVAFLAPRVRGKSGVWYRLNRWREEQITSGKRPTYGHLVRQYIALNKMDRFEKIPYVCYINFLAEFLAREQRATPADARAAWAELKELDVPKDYRSWRKARRS